MNNIAMEKAGIYMMEYCLRGLNKIENVSECLPLIVIVICNVYGTTSFNYFRKASFNSHLVSL